MNINIYLWVASGPLWGLVSGQKQLGAAVWSFWPRWRELPVGGGAAPEDTDTVWFFFYVYFGVVFVLGFFCVVLFSF